MGRPSSQIRVPKAVVLSGLASSVYCRMYLRSFSSLLLYFRILVNNKGVGDINMAKPSTFIPPKVMGVIITENGNIDIKVTSLEVTQEHAGPSIVHADGIVLHGPLSMNTDMTRAKNAMSNMDYKRIIFNRRATIILWKDGTKTIVKSAKNEAFDPEKGVAVAFMKKALGNANAHNKILRKDVKKAMVLRNERIIREEKKAYIKAEKERVIHAAVERP